MIYRIRTGFLSNYKKGSNHQIYNYFALDEDGNDDLVMDDADNIHIFTDIKAVLMIHATVSDNLHGKISDYFTVDIECQQDEDWKVCTYRLTRPIDKDINTLENMK